MKFSGYNKNGKLSLLTDLPDSQDFHESHRQGLDRYVLETKSGLKLEIDRENENVSVVVGSKMHRISNNNGRLFVDGISINDFSNKKTDQKSDYTRYFVHAEKCFGLEEKSDNKTDTRYFIGSHPGDSGYVWRITGGKVEFIRDAKYEPQWEESSHFESLVDLLDPRQKMKEITFSELEEKFGEKTETRYFVSNEECDWGLIWRTNGNGMQFIDKGNFAPGGYANQIWSKSGYYLNHLQNKKGIKEVKVREIEELWAKM